jgi:nucleoside-diphosphate-sugar epimerase
VLCFRAMSTLVGTANVFEAARASGGRVERVVYASSAGVFGPPSFCPPGLTAIPPSP